MAPIRRQWLENAYREYVDKWLCKEWGYARGWNARFPEMVLWYAVAGRAGGGNKMADTFVRQVRAGTPIHPRRRPTWRDAKALTKEICEEHGSNPVDWLIGGCGTPEAAWSRLDEVHGIGSKIASFLMRDLSFMRDYSSGEGGTQVVYRRSIARDGLTAFPTRIRPSSFRLTFTSTSVPGSMARPGSPAGTARQTFRRTPTFIARWRPRLFDGPVRIVATPVMSTCTGTACWLKTFMKTALPCRRVNPPDDEAAGPTRRHHRRRSRRTRGRLASSAAPVAGRAPGARGGHPDGRTG